MWAYYLSCVNKLPILTLLFINLNLFKIIAKLFEKWKYGICSPFIRVHSTVTSKINFGRVAHTLQNMFAKNVIKIRLGKVLKWLICQYLRCVQSTVKLCAQVIKNVFHHLKTSFMQWYVKNVWSQCASIDRSHKISLVNFKKWSFYI